MRDTVAGRVHDALRPGASATLTTFLATAHNRRETWRRRLFEPADNAVDYAFRWLADTDRFERSRYRSDAEGAADEAKYDAAVAHARSTAPAAPQPLQQPPPPPPPPPPA